MIEYRFTDEWNVQMETSKTLRYAIYKNCDISEVFIKVIEIACEISQISATSHTISSSYDSNIDLL